MEARSEEHKPATDPPGSRGATPLPPAAVTRRRAAVIAGHEGTEPDVREFLDDPEPAVRVAAVGALARLHERARRDPEGGPLPAPADVDLASVLITALGDPAPAVRRRGAELSGRLAGAGGLGSAGVRALVNATDDDDASVAEAAAWALGEIGGGPEMGGVTQNSGAPERGGVPDEGAVAALCRMAVDHREPLCREAAVAALGARAEPAGLGIILTALDDRPAVRRRAAVALAAFDDPRAEAGLRRCLEDRDWQVRQVAEDLLGEPPR